MSYVIVVSAHVELCPIKYSNLKYEKKKRKIIIEKMVEINSINFVRVFLTNCSIIFKGCIFLLIICTLYMYIFSK